MENAWDRLTPPQAFSLERLNSLLAPYGVALHQAEPIHEGKANTNLRVQTIKGETFLFRSHQRAPATGVLEKMLTDLLAEETFVAKVILHDSENAFSLVEWKAGRSMESLLLSGDSASVVDAAESIGSALARIHRHRFPAAGFFDANLDVPDPWPSAGIGIAGHIAYLLDQPNVQARLTPTILERLRAVTKSLAARLDEAAPVPVLSHGDFKASNLLIQDGRLSAVVDWEFAHSGTPFVAYGQLFRHPVPDGFDSGFVRGYTSAGGILPIRWRWLARKTDLVNLLDFLNRAPDNAPWTHDLLRLIAERTYHYVFASPKPND